MKRDLPATRYGHLRSRGGFSLLEVMVAIGIFFMVAFTVLALVSQCLSQARALELTRTPIGSLASQTALTNRLEEGFESGDFGDVFPEHRWTRDVSEAGTNGLYEVVLTVSRSGQSKPEAEMTIHLFRPGVAPGRLGGRP